MPLIRGLLEEIKMIKFNTYNVTDGQAKARISYSLDNRIDGRRCVTLYSKDYSSALGQIFQNGYENNTDAMTDYFEKGRVVLFEDSPLYAAARAKAEQVQVKLNARWEARKATWTA